MYRLFKVHKGTCDNHNVPPFSQILSAIGIWSYNLAKLFVPILTQVTINEYTVKDSFKEILDQDPNLFMVSFGNQSLFINIPLDETIDVSVDIAFQKRKKVKDMLKILNTILYFLLIIFFDGVVMGCTWGQLLANLFLVYHERKWFRISRSNLNPNIIVDTLIIFFLCLSKKIM